ncbi:MAG TPA: hypothetical protein VLH86_04450 [Patescibacteria group bacterium]|nr:hypothetical protein [Patescibacteria group bacterium]
MTEKAAASNKDVIYIDVDDEITSIIDKVRGSHNKIVALVLPKRATVLQSVVNMKLLKRASEEAKKNLVLITAEAGLLPLAGSVGVFVAKTLQSKPEVPDAPDRGDSKPESVDEDDAVDDEGDPAEALDKSAPIGELAGAAALEETIELDDDDEGDAEEGPVAVGSAAKAAKKGKNKKFKIPDFNKFRLLLILGGVGVIALIVFGYMALAVLPKATISIKTDSQSVNSSTVVTLTTAADAKFDLATATIPAKGQVVQKTLTQQVDATGQQNNGTQASGKVTLSIKDCSVDSVTVPSGSGVTSGGFTFITQQSATMSSVKIGGVCKNSSYPSISSATVDVIAQKAGASYNLASGSTFAVPGIPAATGTSSTAMTGGTDDIIKIVLQADIDSATQKIGAQDATPIKQELKTDLTNLNFRPIEETFATATPETKTTSNAGDKADSVTVTQTIKYTMLGVNPDDLKKVIAQDVSKKIDTKKQSILDYGLDSIVFGVQSQPAEGAVLTMQTSVVAGPDLKTDDLKKQVAGKKAGDAKEAIKQNPGVTEVDVKYSPFWVSSIPKKTSKITITIEKPKVTTTSKPSDAAGN